MTKMHADGASELEAEAETTTPALVPQPDSSEMTTGESYPGLEPDDLRDDYEEWEEREKQEQELYELDRYSNHLGNGYCGHRTSRNSLIARELGSRPLSEWTKDMFICSIERIAPERIAKFKKIPVALLQCYCLRRNGYHHTSGWRNKTDFYELNKGAVTTISDEVLSVLAKLKEPKPAVETAFGTFNYIEWGDSSDRTGYFGHPDHISIANAKIEAKGKFYSVWDETGKFVVRKKIGSNGTEVVLDPKRPVPKEVVDFLGIKRCDYSMLEESVPTDLFEVSSRGIIYPKGRKPSPEAFDNGLGNFFAIGEKRIGKDCFGNYRIERWNGGWWITDAATATIA